jgi:hypothetical protein
MNLKCWKTKKNLFPHNGQLQVTSCVCIACIWNIQVKQFKSSNNSTIGLRKK